MTLKRDRIIEEWNKMKEKLGVSSYFNLDRSEKSKLLEKLSTLIVTNRNYIGKTVRRFERGEIDSNDSDDKIEDLSSSLGLSDDSSEEVEETTEEIVDTVEDEVESEVEEVLSEETDLPEETIEEISDEIAESVSEEISDEVEESVEELEETDDLEDKNRIWDMG